MAVGGTVLVLQEALAPSSKGRQHARLRPPNTAPGRSCRRPGSCLNDYLSRLRSMLSAVSRRLSHIHLPRRARPRFATLHQPCRASHVSTGISHHFSSPAHPSPRRHFRNTAGIIPGRGASQTDSNRRLPRTRRRVVAIDTYASTATPPRSSAPPGSQHDMRVHRRQFCAASDVLGWFALRS